MTTIKEGYTTKYKSKARKDEQENTVKNKKAPSKKKISKR